MQIHQKTLNNKQHINFSNSTQFKLFKPRYFPPFTIQQPRIYVFPRQYQWPIFSGVVCVKTGVKMSHVNNAAGYQFQSICFVSNFLTSSQRRHNQPQWLIRALKAYYVCLCFWFSDGEKKNRQFGVFQIGFRRNCRKFGDFSIVTTLLMNCDKISNDL